MPKETVQAVRKAELSAAQIEKDALAQKEAILLEAQQNAKALVTSKVKEAQAKAEKDFKEVDRRSLESIEDAKLKAESEVLQLKKSIKNKEQVAIDLVLKKVLS